MPKVFGIPLIGFIQMIIGTAVICFVIIKYLTRPKKAKKGEYIINNVHIIVGDGSELFSQNIYIKNGLIKQVTDKPITNKNAQIIDGSGKTLMPGLIDSHIHIQGINNHSDEESDKFLNEIIPQIFSEKVLPYGITTIKDLCAPKHFIYKLRDKLRSGEITGPELLVVGPNFTTPNGHPANTLGGKNPWIRKEMAIEVTNPEQVSEGINELKTAGVDFLKFTYQGGDYIYFGDVIKIEKLDKSLMQQIISEGKENGLNSTAHVFYYNDVKELLEAGIYGIEHGILDRDIEPDDMIIDLWKKSGTHFVPTVSAMNYEEEKSRMIHSKHNLKVLFDAGIHIAMGTDNMLEIMSGEIEHQELAYYVEAGLTPMQAIISATKNGAEHLGISDRKGLVKEGLEADLILLDKDPAKDISNIKFIDKVFRKGEIVYSQKQIQSFDIPDYSYPDKLLSAKYINSDGNQERVVCFEKYKNDRIVIQKMYQKGELFSEEQFVLNPNLSAVKWIFNRPSDNTNFTALKEGDFINLNGTFNGKTEDKSMNIGNGLWYQMMDISIPAFVNSTLSECLFYCIGTGDNRGAMALSEFAAKKIGEENLTINGTTYSCNKISFVITMFSWAWTGLYWYDKQTGHLIQTGEKKGAKETVIWQIKEFNYE